MRTIKTEDIRAERHPVNGSWLVSAMVNDYLVRRSYYGYTKKEAVAEFNRVLDLFPDHRLAVNDIEVVDVTDRCCGETEQPG